MELANHHNIHLLREGLFYRAYNRSAMRMVLHLKAFKVNHKYVNTVQQEIFYVGFPSNSLPTIKKLAIDKGWQWVEQFDNMQSEGFTPSETLTIEDKDEDYKVWVEKQLQISIAPLTTLNVPFPKLNAPFPKLNAPFPKFLSTFEKVGELEKLITDFPIENATPMEAMMFVNKLKEMIRHGNVR